jgi:phosphoribosylaminoimidazole carboxylase
MDKTIGILGGGQLGQMLCEAAGQLGIKVVVLDAKNSPAKQVNARNAHIDGSFTDPDKIRELARQCDVLSVEIEHVNTDVLEEIASVGVDVIANGKKIKKIVECHPDYRTLRVIQDKFLQKDHLRSFGVAVVDYLEVSAIEANLIEVGDTWKYPYMLKARKDAYDGRGNFPMRTRSDIDEALRALEGRSLYAERWADFKMELAVMVVKTGDSVGDLDLTVAYPAVETIHEDSICKLVYAPARKVPEALQIEAQILARKAVTSLLGKGIFGVELFVLKDSKITYRLEDNNYVY